MSLEAKRIKRIERLSGKKVCWGSWSYWNNVPFLDLSGDMTERMILAEDLRPTSNSHSVFLITEKARDAQEKKVLKRLFWKVMAVANGNCPGNCGKCAVWHTSQICPGLK
jgi:hypothetical protein